MARIKHTKNEMKAQREALARFERFLPMLQLKKQQLQVEIQSINGRIHQVATEEQQALAELEPWLKLWSEPVDMKSLLSVESILTDEGNIAGVVIPLFREIVFRRKPYDLFRTPSWIDDALDVLERLLRFKARRLTFEEQRRCIAAELRTTSQRVNLFEKVKIPECRENIRVIRIFLGDEQTAAVARGKTAKKRAEPALAA